jgi:hypothetical protein
LLAEDFVTRLIELRGVKNRVKRFGVTGGGFLSFRDSWYDSLSSTAFSLPSIFSASQRNKMPGLKMLDGRGDVGKRRG